MVKNKEITTLKHKHNNIELTFYQNEKSLSLFDKTHLNFIYLYKSQINQLFEQLENLKYFEKFGYKKYKV